MAETKPLRLRTQRVPKKIAVAIENSVVQVCVDTGVYHLPDQYDYLVPESLSVLMVPGVFVKVPFGKNEVAGYVVSRLKSEVETSKLKLVSKLISPLPLLTEELIEIINFTCERYACKPWDVIRSAIPSRVAGPESIYESHSLSSNTRRNPKPKHQLTVTNSPDSLGRIINEILERNKESEQLLVIVPDERDLIQLLDTKLNHEPVLLTSNIDKSERYANYLKTRFLQPKLIVGTRSAIFTPLNPSSTILIFNDGDESMYERRHPNWNVRDIALLRSGDFSLHFLGASPTLETVRLAELGWIGKKSEGAVKREIVFSDSRTSDLSVIKEGLKVGNVLVVLAEVGYINSIACQKCRNRAVCECGGKLFLPSKGASPQCYLCTKVYSDWQCDWCQGKTIRTISKGSDRIAEEIGKAVPGYRVLTSKGSKRLDVLPNLAEHILVIASYGCEPKGNYAAVVLKSVENLANRVELRSLESARRLLFENLIRVRGDKGSRIFVDLESNHPISQQLIRANAYDAALLEINDREVLNLPPFTRIAIISGESAAIRQLATQLEDNSLLHTVAVQPLLDKSETGKSQSRLILRANIVDSKDFSDFLRDLARYRGIKGLTSFQIRMDPFAI